MLARTSPRVRDSWTAGPCGRGARRRVALPRSVLVGLLATSGLALQVLPAGADSTVSLRLTAEAWYRPLPLPVAVPPVPCTPAGCVPPVAVPAANPYPAKTLHVGASAGAEEARTYIALDTAALPFGAEVAGGTLVLPVLADATAGTLAPETASIQVCLATAAVQDGVEGSVVGAPPADCTTSSKAAFTPASGSKPAAFTADLKPFATAIAAGISSFAVVPLVQAGDTGAWHVAFSRRDRQGGTPISAGLTLAGDARADTPTEPPVPSGGSDSAGLPPVGTGSSPGMPLGSPQGAPQPPQTAPVSPQVSSPTQGVPVAASSDTRFAYPAIFLLPLVLAAAVGWAARAMTRELIPARG